MYSSGHEQVIKDYLKANKIKMNIFSYPALYDTNWVKFEFDNPDHIITIAGNFNDLKRIWSSVLPWFLETNTLIIDCHNPVKSLVFNVLKDRNKIINFAKS